MNESVCKESSNKKADDAICQFVAEHETGVIAPEVAEAFAIGKTTAREALGRLEDAGRLSTRAAGSTIKLYYAEDDAVETAATVSGEADSSGNVFGSVEFLTDDQLAYLMDGTLNEHVEPHILDHLSEQIVEKVWEIPYNDGPDRDQMELVARRIDVSMADIQSMTPSEAIKQIDTIANDLRTDFDLLYHPFRTPRMEEFRTLRQKLSCTQSEVAESLSEVTNWEPSTCQSKLSMWESVSSDPGKDIQERLAAIYREFYEEDHDPYRNREDWDWPGTTESCGSETAREPDSSTFPSESDSEDDLASAIRRIEQPQPSSEVRDDG
jgi:transcriptional regulator with XRE-family HTH domain